MHHVIKVTVLLGTCRAVQQINNRHHVIKVANRAAWPALGSVVLLTRLNQTVGGCPTRYPRGLSHEPLAMGFCFAPIA
jgi:hypothetical protein